MRLARREVFEVWRTANASTKNRRDQQVSSVIAFAESKFRSELNGDLPKSVRSALQKFLWHLGDKWSKCGRSEEVFLKFYRSWLDGPHFECSTDVDNMHVSVPRTPASFSGNLKRRGRPPKRITDVCPRSQRRKTMSLRSDYLSHELCSAAFSKLQSEGKRAQARIVNEATLSSPTRASKMCKVLDSSVVAKPSSPLSADEALAHLVKNNLTKQQYIDMRLEQISKNCCFLPPYEKVREAKNRCYPPKEDITITSDCAEIKLQAILDITVKRLTELQHPVFLTLPSCSLGNLVLISKWGSDGATGQSEYKQKGPNEHFSDASLYVVSLVPLEMYIPDQSLPGGRLVVWENPSPSSTAYCRPIKLRFVKESAAVTVSETENIKSQIAVLHRTELQETFGTVLVRHDLKLTMIDGKVAAALTSFGAQCCSLCGATPKIMNSIDLILTRDLHEDNLQYGLSTLHAWIRSMEYVLHIAYRIEFKSWQAKGPYKQISEDRKKLIQQRFRKDLGLRIDEPRSGGAGNSNDGNTARRFFDDPAKTSTITGVDEDLITRLGVILQALSSGFPIDPAAYKTYALETARKFVNMYGWYYMPAAVHKMLCMVLR